MSIVYESHLTKDRHGTNIIGRDWWVDGQRQKYYTPPPGKYELVKKRKLTREAVARALCGEATCTVIHGTCESCQLWKGHQERADRLLAHLGVV